MGDRYLIIIILLVVLVIGFIRLLMKHRSLVNEANFAQEYLTKFRKFANSYLNSFDGQLYDWLNHRLIKINSQIGILGEVDYRPPFANYIVKNYQLIPNTLGEMRSRMAHPSLVAKCDDILVRYIGLADDWLTTSSKRLKNPFVWLREGVQSILALPILVLNWLGVISITTVNSLNENLFFKVLSGLVALVGLLAGIVTIALGWERFLDLFN